MSDSLPLPSDSLDLIPVPTLALLADGTVGAANQAAVALCGRGDLEGSSFRDLLDPRDADTIDLLDAGGDALRLLHADGEPRFVRLFSRPVDGGGALVCLPPAPSDALVDEISGGLLDATLLARAVHSANNSIVVADVSRPDQPLVFVNQGFLRLTGYDADAVLGRNCRFLQVPGGATMSEEALTGALSAQENDEDRGPAEALRRAIDARENIDGLVLRNYTADGHAFWNELYLTPVSDGDGVTHYVGVQNDVTDRVKAQRRLSRQASQLKDLLDSMPTPIGLLESFDGGRIRHVLANASAAEAFALDPDTEVGLDGLGFRGHARGLWIDAVHRAYATGIPVGFEVEHTGGRTFEVSVSPVRDGPRNDASTRFFYLARDVTDGRRLEGDLLQISARELSRVAQNIHDGVGQTLVGASMLSAGLASALRRGGHDEIGNAERLHDLVRAALSQLRQFALGLDPVDVDDHGVDHVMERMAADMAALFGIDVRYAPTDHPTDLPTETALDIYRVAQEATTNAIRHGHAESVVVRLSANEHVLELVVEDDGEGIPDTALVDADGMGLRTMRARARRLGGPLTVARRPGGGTVVTVRVDRRSESLLATPDA